MMKRTVGLLLIVAMIAACAAAPQNAMQPSPTPASETIMSVATQEAAARQPVIKHDGFAIISQESAKAAGVVCFTGGEIPGWPSPTNDPSMCAVKVAQFVFPAGDPVSDSKMVELRQILNEIFTQLMGLEFEGTPFTPFEWVQDWDGMYGQGGAHAYSTPAMKGWHSEVKFRIVGVVPKTWSMTNVIALPGLRVQFTNPELQSWMKPYDVLSVDGAAQIAALYYTILSLGDQLLSKMETRNSSLGKLVPAIVVVGGVTYLVITAISPDPTDVAVAKLTIEAARQLVAVQ